MTQSQNSSTKELLTTDAIIEIQKAFKEQREDMKLCVGYTFTQEAWDQVRAKFKDPDTPIDKWGIDGVPVLICTKQRQPMIGWFNKQIMMAFISIDGDLDVPQVNEEE